MIIQNIKLLITAVAIFQLALTPALAQTATAQSKQEFVTIPVIHFERLREINEQANKIMPIEAIQFPNNDEVAAGQVFSELISRYSQREEFLKELSELYNSLKDFFSTGGIISEQVLKTDEAARTQLIISNSKTDLKALHPLVFILARKIIFDSYVQLRAAITPYHDGYTVAWGILGLLTMGAGFAGDKAQKRTHYRQISNLATADSCTYAILATGTANSENCFNQEVSQFSSLIKPMYAAGYFYNLIAGQKVELGITSFFTVSFEASPGDSLGFQLADPVRIIQLYRDRVETDIFAVSWPMGVAVQEIRDLGKAMNLEILEIAEQLTKTNNAGSQ